MAFETYRTWSVGEIVTAAQLNEQLRDNGNELIKGGLTVVFDGGGGSIGTDTLVSISETPYKLVIDAVTVKSSDSADSDTFEVDIRVPPTASNASAATDSICASALPVLDTDNPTYKRDTTLTGWTTTVAEAAAVDFIVTKNGGVTKASLSLTWNRST